MMHIESFIILAVLLVFVGGQWQNGETFQKRSAVTTRKYKPEPRRCDTFFHKRTVNSGKDYRAALDGRILIMVRNIMIQQSAIQITDGRRVLKLHYGRRRLGDATGTTPITCDLLTGRVAVASFLREFVHTRRSSLRGLCVDVDHILDELGGSVVDPADWILRGINVDLHVLRDDATQLCGGDQELTALVHELGEAISSVVGQQQQLLLHLHHQRSGMRHRRSVGPQIIMPGTRWCGDGNVSTADQSYGNIVALDRCCQQHDRCTITIPSFTRKYGLFNYRMYTISHCECDDVFRSCLRTVGSEEAHLVGNLFFNVIGTKCFVIRIQRESVCADRAWYGRCIREEMVNNEYAEIRGPLNF